MSRELSKSLSRSQEDLVAGLKEAVRAPFEVVEALNEQGIFKLFLTYQKVLDRKVELRLIRVKMETGSPEEERLHELYRELGQIDHPAVYKVMSTGEVRGAPYFIVEHRDALCLKEWIRTSGAMGLEEAVRFGFTLAEILEDYHGKGVPFAGLSPETLMYDHTTHQVYLGDFPPERLFSRKVLDGVKIAASWSWRYTEWSQGSPPDALVDVALVGQVLYYVLTGREPESLPAATPSWDPPSSCPSQALRALIDRTLSPDRSQRPQSATRLKKALAGVLSKEKIKDAAKSAAEESKLRDIATRSRVLRLEDLGLSTTDFHLNHEKKKRPPMANSPAISWVREKAPVLAAVLALVVLCYLFFTNVEIRIFDPVPIRTAKENTLSAGQKNEKLRIAETDLRDAIARFRTRPTEPDGFLRQWTAVREWIILQPARTRKTLCPYIKLVNLLTRFRTGNDPQKAEACREMDRLLLKLETYLQERKGTG